MKFNNLAAAVALGLLCGGANAGFTTSFTGPTALTLGQTGTFELTVKYTPIELPQNTVNSVIEWYNYTASAGAWLNVMDSFGHSETQLKLIFDGSYNPNLIEFSGHDPHLPYEGTASFAWTPLNAGLFSVNGHSTIQEVTYNRPGPACAAMYPNDWDTCKLNGPLTDVSYVTNGYQDGATLSVNVSPVPEPDNIALMLAGLGVSGAVSRRRKVAEITHTVSRIAL